MPRRKSTSVAEITVTKLFRPNYQRPLSESRCRTIAANWNEHLAQTLDVSSRGNGKYAIIDGGHRLEAAKQRGATTVRCVIHTGLSYEEEASLYRKLNKERKRINSVEDHIAAVEAKDIDALALDSIVTEHGFSIGGRTAHSIQSVATLRRMQKVNAAMIGPTLAIALEHVRRWDHQLPGELIEGIFILLVKAPADYLDMTRVTNKVASKNAAYWRGQAYMGNSARRGVHVAAALQREYEKGRRGTKVAFSVF